MEAKVAAPAQRGPLAATAGVALAAALVFSFQILRMPPGVGQFSKYPNAALQYLHGTAQPERLLDFSPLYLGLHIAVFQYLQNPIAWIAWIQIAFLTLAAALLYLLLRRHVGTGFAVAGAAAFVLGKSVVIYGYVFEPEALMIVLLVALVFFASREDLPGAAAAGVALALCVLTRPGFLPLAAVVPLSFWLRRRGRRRFAAATALFLLPVIAALAFIAARNQRLLGSASLLVMNPGTVFFDCNSPLASGGGAAYPPVVNDVAALYAGESDYHHAVFRLVARAVTGRDLTPGEANRFWSAKAADFIVDHPRRFAALLARRALHVFNRYRWNDLRTEWAAGRVLDGSWFPFVPFAPLSALALLGLAIGLASWRTFLLPLAVFLNQAGLMVLTYATDRQRVSLYPFFAFFGAVALSRLCTGGRWRRTLLAALLPLALLFTLDSDLMRDNRRLWEAMSRMGAFVGEARGDRDNLDFAAARVKTARALAIAPWAAETLRPSRLPVAPGELARLAVGELPAPPEDDAPARLDRALLLLEAGRVEEAAAILLELEREGHIFESRNGDSSEPSYHLGRIAFSRGRLDEAVRLMRQALRRSPGHPAVLAQLACLTGDGSWIDQLLRYFDDFDALFYLGRACLETGRVERAVESFGSLVTRFPDHARGQVYYAAALGAAGRDAEAAAMFLSATEERPETVMLEGLILPSLERWARGGSPGAAYWYAVALREYGRFPGALQAFERASAAGNPAAAREAQELREIIAQAQRR